MKRVFSLPGMLTGLAAAVLVGLFATRMVGWFLVGLAVGVALAAFPVVARIKRHKDQEQDVSRGLNPVARG